MLRRRVSTREGFEKWEESVGILVLLQQNNKSLLTFLSNNTWTLGPACKVDWVEIDRSEEHLARHNFQLSSRFAPDLPHLKRTLVLYVSFRIVYSFLLELMTAL